MKDISKREYNCPKCGNRIDKDINASINLVYEGVKLLINKKLIEV